MMHLIAVAAFNLLVIGIVITAVIGPFYLHKLYKENQL
jgi:hypothetical protein